MEAAPPPAVGEHAPHRDRHQSAQLLLVDRPRLLRGEPSHRLVHDRRRSACEIRCVALLAQDDARELLQPRVTSRDERIE